MHVQSFCVNPFQMNCLVCHDAGDAILIDPGTYGASERTAVLDYLKEEGLVLRQIVLTHGHLDHIFDLDYFTRAFELPYGMHEDDLPLIHDAPHRTQTYGLRMETPPEPGRTIREGDQITVGEVNWEVMHTPGHSPGSISFVDRTNGFVIGGDVLFRGSIGRTDLWKGSTDTLLRSIEEKMMTLPDDYTVYCGHGPATTIGTERASNPFLLR